MDRISWHFWSWFRADTRAIEVLSSYAALNMALTTFFAGETSSTIWPRLVLVFPTLGWIGALFALSGIQSIGVCFNIISLRRIGAVLACFAWALVAFLYWLSGLPTTTGLYALLAAAALWVEVRGPSDGLGRI